MTEGKRKNSRGPALSLWALLARCSIYKVLAVLAVMTLTETALFYSCLKSSMGSYTLAGAVESSHISVVFLVALGLIYFILAWTERRLDTESSATMLRLRLSGGRIFMIKAAYNVTCMVILFAVQIWLAIWLVGIYGRVMNEVYASPQRLFLAFYRINFLHCLLPMAEVGKWVRNLLLLLALGIEAAVGDRKAKNETYLLVALYVLSITWFVSSMGRSVIDPISDIVYAIVIATNIWQVRKRQRERM